VRFHRKKIRPSEVPEFTLVPQQQFFRLLTLLRLAILLNIKRQDDILPPLVLAANDNILSLTLPEGWLSQKPVFTLDLEREADYLKDIEIKLVVN